MHLLIATNKGAFILKGDATRRVWKVEGPHFLGTECNHMVGDPRDGKSWLLKVTRKGKTIFWLSIVDGSFRTTFYFGDKAGRAIARSAISDALKKQFKGGKHYGKIRGVTILYKKKRDVEDARELIELKLSMK